MTTLDVAEVLAAVEPGISRRVDRRGLGQGEAEGGGADAWADEAPVLAGLAAGPVQETVALGRHRSRRLRRLGHGREPVEAPTPGPRHAQWKGYDLHAGLGVTDEGAVRLQLRQPWAEDDARRVRPRRVPGAAGGARAAAARHTVRTVTGGILWANPHLLFWLSVVPFVTGWMGENHFAPMPTALYGVVLLMAETAYWILQRAIIRSQGAGSLLKQALGGD